MILFRFHPLQPIRFLEMRRLMTRGIQPSHPALSNMPTLSRDTTPITPKGLRQTTAVIMIGQSHQNTCFDVRRRTEYYPLHMMALR